MRQRNFHVIFFPILAVLIWGASEITSVLSQTPVPQPSPTPVTQPSPIPVAQPAQTPAAQPAQTPAAQPAQTPAAQPSPTMKATLVDAENKAKKQAATVEVKVSGIEIIDPAQVNEMAKPGQGHLHYQVDGGPVIATTTTKLSFHGLTPGEHKIVVMLAANDHTPLGPQETLTVKIP